MRVLNWSYLLLSLGMLVGCFPRGDPSRPIPTEFVAAPQKAQRLVVVLPGRGDDVKGLQRSGITQAIQQAWPDADVVLTGLALGYYMEGQAVPRLHAEVIEPARKRGYAQVWLVGASLGGMGALLYDQAHPNQVDGLVLLAPYLGEKALLQEIAAAGGVARWQPPPAPRVIDGDNFQPELWRYLQTWSRPPGPRPNVWVAYGTRDRLRGALPLIAPLLPPQKVLEPAGGHDWEVWSPITREILSRVAAAGLPAR
ncbi:MAG: alpha/beta hydrolase [Ramlibacter sp.]|jgi:pimeloyl-ACP methyl ester carboxylesterase|nr:alpha/beta hydrolase [Ramlibacter sp.]MCE3272158.1 alpha/beta hydrolase [Ramlibacter sp.]